ncbi:MAG: hypothetical protein HY812_03290 [Planctomycetes bacterium]|nr:hypothetical protein [Planctomycetota bacterium]
MEPRGRGGAPGTRLAHRKLEEECLGERHEALRPFVRPEVFERVMEPWSEASLEDDGG